MPDPNKIEGGRWDRVLRSIFNLKGAGSTAARIAEDISATFNFPYRPEHDFLIGEKLMWGRGVSSAGAAQNPRIILTNSSDNKLTIIEGFTLDIAGGGVPYCGMTSGIIPFIADVPVFVRDGRYGDLQTDQGSGAARLQDGPLIGAPTPVLQSFTNTAVGYSGRFDFTAILSPGDSFFLTNATLNSLIVATIYWREHLMEPTEVA